MLDKIKANGLDTDNLSHAYIYDLGLTTLFDLSQQTLSHDSFTKAYIDVNTQIKSG